VRAVLAPHAGYRYSGAVAARAFAAAARPDVEDVILIGPSHVEALDFTAVFDGDGFATPLGTVHVDTGLAHSIATHGDAIRMSARGHAFASGRGEHAIEVMLPFIQRTMPHARIVAITMGSQTPAACDALAAALHAHVAPTRSLLVASSDLSHFHPYDEAVRLDERFCELVESGDAGVLLEQLADGNCEACGGGPTAAVMLACSRAGVPEPRVLARINSGDVTGQHDSVVGYAAAIWSGRA
jgi:AmmeMemoRadiSam system protein B